MYVSSLSTFLSCLSDYTVDQRGDVGSWVRLAALAALRQYVVQAISALPPSQPVLELLPQARLDEVVGGMAKQAVEKLDNVREVAGRCLLEVVGAVEASRGRWEVRGGGVWEGLREGREEWRRFEWASERVMPLLAVREYRGQLLEGVILGVVSAFRYWVLGEVRYAVHGSADLSPAVRSQSTHATSSPLLDFALGLMPTASEPGEYSLLQLVADLRDLGRKHFSANRLFVPTLVAVGGLLEGGVLDALAEEEEGVAVLADWLALATRSMDRIKSGPRLGAVVKVSVCRRFFLNFFASHETPAR